MKTAESKNKMSIFGSTGFIGNRYCELYPNQTIRIPRSQYFPEKGTDILYLISTVDNYNIYDNLHIDIDTNLSVLMNVLDEIKKYNPEDAPIINFISSWCVYGQNPDIPFKEDTSFCYTTGFYSITKRCAEQMLICFCKTFGYKYRILRLANILGKGDKKISTKRNSLQYLAKKIVRNEDIKLYDGGEFVRDYMYIDDACEAIHLCCERGELNSIINIGTGVPTKFKDLIEMIIKESNSTSKYYPMEPSPFHKIVQVKNSFMDTTKLQNLGFRPKFDLRCIAKILTEYHKNEMHGP